MENNRSNLSKEQIKNVNGFCLQQKEKGVKNMLVTKNYNMDVIEENNLVAIVNDNFEKVDQALLDVAYTHPESGVTSGTYGSNTSTVQEPGFGGIFSVPGFTVDKEGHITSANSHMVALPGNMATASAAGLMSAEDKTKLDKIESGTWTPGNAGGGTTTYSKGYYRRFGDIVFVSGYIQQSTSQDDMVISRLPFSPALNPEDLVTNKTDCIGQFTAYGGMKNAHGDDVFTGFVTTYSGLLRFYDDSYYGSTNNGFCGKLSSNSPLIFSAIYKIGSNY